MNPLNYNRYTGYARISAQKAGLGIVFHEENIQPHTDGKSIHVQRPSATWSREQWDMWWYYIEHEIGHEREPWREWKEVMRTKKVTRTNIIGFLNNLNSDQAQEHDRMGEFRGVDIRLGEGRREFILKNAKSSGDPMWDAVWKYDAETRAEWNPCMAGVSDTLTVDAEGQDYYDKLTAWGRSAAECTNEWEVYDFTIEMLKVLGQDTDQLEQEMQDAYDGKQGDGTSGDGEVAEGASSTEVAEGGDESAAQVGGTSRYEDYFEHKHEEKEEAVSGNGDLHIDYTGWSGDAGAVVLRDIDVVDFAKGDTIPERGRGFDSCKSSSGFSSSVRKILQVKSAQKYEGGKRRGRLQSKNLWRSRLDDDRIFKTKVDTLNLKDVAVQLLVDFSGSMSGTKIHHACSACLMLNDAITKLGVATQIFGFIDGGSAGPTEYRIKKFGESVTEDTIINRFSQCSARMYSNADGESLLSAYASLMRRKESRKILIVLSDGSPAGNGSYDDDAFLLQVTRAIEKEKTVSLYGIGICDDNVERFYTHRTVVDDANELESKLLDVVKSQILVR